MEGFKPLDFTAGSPIARVPGTAGRGNATGPRPIAEAPDPILVPEKSAPEARSPVALVSQVEVRGLVREMASAPPIDRLKVQNLKARIDSGTFTIDPARVAEAMLGSLRSQAA